MPKKPRMIVCSDCGKKRMHYSKEKCQTCYQKNKRKQQYVKNRPRHNAYVAISIIRGLPEDERIRILRKIKEEFLSG